MSRTPRPYTRLPLRAKNVPGELEHADPVLGTPPRKRAVPADDVHVRNIPEYASGKRSRTLRAPDAARDHPATTLRVDHAVRMSRDERYQREHHKTESQRQWKEAFVKAFPKLVFYLDHIDASQKAVFTAQIMQLGGRVEAFFSRSVTHVVTTRPVPVAKEKENTDPRRARRSGIAPPRVVTPTNVSFPVHSDKNPFEDCAPSLPASDLLCKAQHFGMKIWRQDKLQNILSLLLAEDAGVDDTRQNLSEMLHQEKLHGTTERDPLALRNDYHYFGKHSYYLLVTDATNEHRPIAIAEYDRTAHEVQHKPPPWPVLYGDVEGRGLFVYVKPKDRARLAAQDVPPPRPGHLSLRRAASLNLAGVLPRAPESSHAPGTPNLMASDNSMALASTVASTTSASLHSQGTQPGGAVADKRLAELTRRMHTPIDLKRATGRGSVVRRMLGMEPEHETRGLRRSQSLNGTRDPLKPREKRPGHCENCRCRFEDFDEHTRSRRHRKFAMDESNFVALDELLQRVQREPAEQAPWGHASDLDTLSDPAADTLDDACEFVAQEPYVAGSELDGDPIDVTTELGIQDESFDDMDPQAGDKALGKDIIVETVPVLPETVYETAPKAQNASQECTAYLSGQPKDILCHTQLRAQSETPGERTTLPPPNQDDVLAPHPMPNSHTAPVAQDMVPDGVARSWGSSARSASAPPGTVLAEAALSSPRAASEQRARNTRALPCEDTHASPWP